MSKYTKIRKSVYSDKPVVKEYFTTTGKTVVDAKRREYKEAKRQYKKLPWNKK